MPIADLVDHRVIFLTTRLVDAIVLIEPRDDSVRRDRIHVELVDVVELRRFGFRGASHTAELLIEPEVILNRDRRERLGLAVDLNALLRFDSLM